MNQFDLIESWLNQVSYSHSHSIATEERYKRVWSRSTSFSGKISGQIVTEFEVSEKRDLIRKYAQFISA
jgi:hypothetical protein